MTVTEQARLNRAYVRRLLDEKQPELAAVLKIVEQQLAADCRTTAVQLDEACCGASPLAAVHD